MNGVDQITNAIHEVMCKVGYVQKKNKNEFHKYKYAGEAVLLETLRPAMVEAGLMLIPCGSTIQPIDEYGNTHLKMDYWLAHKSGQVWPEKLSMFGAGNDKNSKGGVGDKGTYKAITGANKYILFKLFQIETGDDPEKDTGDTSGPKETKQDVAKELSKPISESQRKRMFAIASKHQWPDTAVKSLLAKYHYESSKDITWKDYDGICEELSKVFTEVA